MIDTATIENLKYPVGKFSRPPEYTKPLMDDFIRTIELLPEKLKAEIQNLNDEQLDTPYRENGWTVRQVVHHLADSHMNAYIRCKLAMTEELPVIKPYFEDRWAELTEAKEAPAEVSISLLEALHRRWVLFLRSISESDMTRKFHHPETKKDMEIRTIIALYAWHSRHHLAHITSLKERMGWGNKK
jgi:uncharacterized damage-inducible protein DinB